MDFGKWLDEKQAELGMNDKEFSAFVGIAPSTRSHYRRGAGVNLDTVSKIADRLGVEVLGEPVSHMSDSVPCTIADLRNCLEHLYPNLPGDDVDELVEIAQMKAARVGKALGGAAK